MNSSFSNLNELNKIEEGENYKSELNPDFNFKKYNIGPKELKEEAEQLGGRHASRLNILPSKHE